MKTKTKQTLGIIILTYNSEKTIQRCLESALFADEILVVDSGSSDNTLSICKQYTQVTIIQNTWQGYALQRNFAISQASSDWLFMLDSDEYLSDNSHELKNKIQTTANNYIAVKVYLIFQNTVCLYAHNKHSGTLRLFRRKEEAYSVHKHVHEQLCTDEPHTYLPEYIIFHESWQSIHDMLVKLNRYTSLNAQYSIAHKPRKTSLPRACYRCLWSFFKHYIIKSGWRDGRAGFVYCIYYAISSLFHSLKIMYPEQKTNATMDLQKQTKEG